MKLIDYLGLFKFRYHLSFILVIMGALLFSSTLSFGLFLSLLILYISFNICLYGGLYTLNDIADVKSDAAHPTKKNRPLPSKRISLSSAYIFAFILIFTGLLIAYFYFGLTVFLLFLLFIAANLFYTRSAKKIPYLEIVFNSFTYPMRFFLGIVLVSQIIPYFLFVAIFLLAFGVASVRRILEKRYRGWEARKVLKYYTEKKLIIIEVLAFILIIMLLFVDYPVYTIWYIIIVLLYIVLVFGIYASNYLIRIYRWLFLN